MKKVNEIKNNVNEDINIRKTIFRILISFSGTLFILYVFLIGSIIINTNTRKSLESIALDLTIKVDKLDSSYLNSINNIDKEYATSHGFIEANQNIFASRNINYVVVR